VNGLRIALSVVGVLMCLVGGVFFLQGIGVIGGSFMSHTLTWTIIGVVMVTAGAMMLSASRPPGRGRRPAR
jgi:glucose uptake protein GlcU